MSLLKNMSWTANGIQHLTKEEMKERIELLKSQGYTEVEASTKTERYDIKTYSIKQFRGKYLGLSVVDEYYNKSFYSTNYKDDSKNLQIGAGTDAYNSVNKRFKERNKIGITKAFSSVNEEFKVCVPRQFYYINELYKNQFIMSASSIDYCSQYPSMLCGLLPDAHTDKQMRCEGTVGPTKEYPFAFYLKSGHCAQYGVFDTHDWCNSPFRSSLLGHKQSFDGNPYLDPKDDVTILMKASKYNLTNEMEYYYGIRKTDATAKLVMNAFIGMFHTDSYKSHKQAHLAAIVIARANDRMRRLAEEIGYMNVLHICVDGCIYKGSTEYGTNKKALKECNQEFTDCAFKMIGMNSYVAMKGNEVVKFKHGAYDARKDGIDIEICENFNTMYQWYKKPDIIEEM